MRIVTFATLILGAGLAAAPAFAEPEVHAGEYVVKGTNFDGSPYSGTAHIAITSNSTCEITWKTGGSSSAGICMRDTDSFAAAYRMATRSASSSTRSTTTARSTATGRSPASPAPARRR